MKEYGKCRILAKNHIVSSVVTEFTVNGVVNVRTKRTAHLKPFKARTRIGDRAVFNAIHEVGHDWADVTNYLDGRTNESVMTALDREINRHCV